MVARKQRRETGSKRKWEEPDTDSKLKLCDSFRHTHNYCVFLWSLSRSQSKSNWYCTQLTHIYTHMYANTRAHVCKHNTHTVFPYWNKYPLENFPLYVIKYPSGEVLCFGCGLSFKSSYVWSVVPSSLRWSSQGDRFKSQIDMVWTFSLQNYELQKTFSFTRTRLQVHH